VNTLYPLIFEPLKKERIWGGTALSKYDLTIQEHETIGELWTLSQHPNGETQVKNGKYKGQTLTELLQNHSEYILGKKNTHFRNQFPLLIKLLDAKQDLSVQVHPNDDYANRYENGENGKTECWYVLKAEPGSKIYYGHNFKARDELRNAIKNGTVSQGIRWIHPTPGDFIYVPSGTLHALGKGVMVAEIQQSSDVTYRVYDWDRVDEKGNRRDLHIDKALEVTSFEKTPAAPIKGEVLHENKYSKITLLLKEKYYTIELIEANDNLFQESPEFEILTVVAGEGKLVTPNGEEDIIEGQSVLIPASVVNYELLGNQLKILKCTV
jgi:mannose-6-phosphate isomerase